MSEKYLPTSSTNMSTVSNQQAPLLQTISQKPIINKVKNRLLFLSPTVKACLEPECQKTDFCTEGPKALGKGGFGEVWKVIHKKTNNIYVIKVIDKKNIIEQKLVEQMNREIEIMYKVDHPHIVKLVNHFEDDSKFYLILHYASKGQLYSLLKKQGKFDEKTTAQFIRETIEAVKYLHSFDPPIIHRDIKPENLLLDENLRIKLADFGWSNFKDNEETRNTYCGTPEYLSPEMVKRIGHDSSVDIWSLGVLLFELLAGYAPFSGANQDELFSNIRKIRINWPTDFPPLAKNLITRILKLNPKERMTLDEILMHTWFEKNPLSRPVLKKQPADEKLVLLTHMINTRNFSNKAAEEEKMLRKSIITKTRQTNANNGLEGQYGADSAESDRLKAILQAQHVECEKLNKENSQLKTKLEKVEADFLSLKTENLKLREGHLSAKALQDENLKLKEEIDKFKVLNQDRIGLLSELEEKNNLIFELKNEIKNLENEIESIAKMESQLRDKNKELNSSLESNEAKIKEMRMLLIQAEKEREDLASSYQKKLEIMQIKLFNKTDSEDAGSESNLSQVSKVIEIFNDSLAELKSQFGSKIANLINTFSEIKEKCMKSESSIMSIINEKSVEVLDVIRRVRNALEEDINKARFRLNAENKSKTSDIIEWYKKQVQELQPFKSKFNALDSQLKIIENANKQLNFKVNDYEVRIATGEKLENLCKEKIQELQRKIEDLEAKLCDIKHFVYNNLNGDLLDEFNSFYNNQTIK